MRFFRNFVSKMAFAKIWVGKIFSEKKIKKKLKKKKWNKMKEGRTIKGWNNWLGIWGNQNFCNDLKKLKANVQLFYYALGQNQDPVFFWRIHLFSFKWSQNLNEYFLKGLWFSEKDVCMTCEFKLKGKTDF